MRGKQTREVFGPKGPPRAEGRPIGWVGERQAQGKFSDRLVGVQFIGKGQGCPKLCSLEYCQHKITNIYYLNVTLKDT